MKTLFKDIIRDFIVISIFTFLFDLIFKRPITLRSALINLAAVLIGVALIHTVIMLWNRCFKKKA